jgi:hypothetical protein
LVVANLLLNLFIKELNLLVLESMINISQGKEKGILTKRGKLLLAVLAALVLILPVLKDEQELSRYDKVVQVLKSR